ncbi:hypothetical protein [Pseudoduganella sp. OTU4001]|uniref:hypothetical protein n=1 Tax=Pseudoduganella sp. OTU4001 TaxID=3043854 RepID=UPI00313DAB84
MVNQQQPGEQLDAKGAARRRFTRAGAAASGVLLTLHSQPGLAGGVACTTPSGFQSIEFGSHNPRNTTCLGRSPGGWKSNLNKANNKLIWPVNPDNTMFKQWFSNCSSTYAGTLGQDTTSLRTVLNSGPSFDPQQLGKHFVAAYLNFLSGRSPVPKPETLVAMWNALNKYPYTYTPTAGAKPWDADQVKVYLTSTWV